MMFMWVGILSCLAFVTPILADIRSTTNRPTTPSFQNLIEGLAPLCQSGCLKTWPMIQNFTASCTHTQTSNFSPMLQCECNCFVAASETDIQDSCQTDFKTTCEKFCAAGPSNGFNCPTIGATMDDSTQSCKCSCENCIPM